MASVVGGSSTSRTAVTAAIDFGTSGTGAVILFSASRNDSAPIRVALDGRTSDGSIGKAPSAILLQAKPPHAYVSFGDDAFQRYADFKSRNEHSGYLLFSEFKMQLRPGGTKYGRGDPTSFTVGAADRPDKYELLLPVVATLRHAKSCIMAQVLRMRGKDASESDVSCVCY